MFNQNLCWNRNKSPWKHCFDKNRNVLRWDGVLSPWNCFWWVKGKASLLSSSVWSTSPLANVRLVFDPKKCSDIRRQFLFKHNLLRRVYKISSNKMSFKNPILCDNLPFCLFLGWKMLRKGKFIVVHCLSFVTLSSRVPHSTYFLQDLTFKHGRP